MEICWWEHCSNSWEEIILYTHIVVNADFLPLSSQRVCLRTTLFYVDDHLKNNFKDH